MKKAKLFILLISSIVLSALFSGCSIGNRLPKSTLDRILLKDEIVIGVKNDSKPFGFLKNDNLEGFDIDIAKFVAKKILDSDDETKIRFKVLTPDERIYSLISGDIDMVIATMSITPQRLQNVDFSKPYYVAGLAVLVNKNSKIQGINDLNNRDVVVILGTTGESTLRYIAPSAKIRGARTYPEAFQMLKNGTVEAVFADDSLLYGFLSDNKNYKILPKRYSEEFYAIAIKKGDKRLQNKLNVIVDEIHQNGVLQKIRQKWLWGR